MGNNAAEKVSETRLSQSTLNELPANVKRPGYDRGAVKINVMHMSVGGFHRSHMALYLEELFEKHGLKEWAICGVGLLPSDSKMLQALGPQDCLYTLVERGDGTEEYRVIGAIREFLHAAENPERVLARLADPEIRLVSLTVTEKGYCISSESGDLDRNLPELQNDLNNPSAPKTVLGYLVEGLARRHAAGIKPFTVLCCDNLQSNGDTVRRMVCGLAEMRDPALAEWIQSIVAFPNSMVDRITPMTAAEDLPHVEKKIGLRDEWPVVCEPFIQWIIEDKFGGSRPPFEKVGVQFTNNVHPYEVMKIRLLNASHSAMCYLGYLLGHRYIHDVMSDVDMRRFIKAFMDVEVTELVPAVAGIDLEKYKNTLVERFANPAVKDQVLRICMDGSSKLPKFILPSIREQIERGGDIKRMSLAIAAWIRFLNGVDEQGKSVEINDPMASKLQPLAAQGQKDPSNILNIREIFGDDLPQNQTFIATVRDALGLLYDRGARATLKQFLT